LYSTNEKVFKGLIQGLKDSYIENLGVSDKGGKQFHVLLNKTFLEEFRD
jgi:hypothetical protein